MEKLNEFANKHIGIILIISIVINMIMPVRLNRKINVNHGEYIKKHIDSVQNNYKKIYSEYIRKQIKNRLIIEQLTETIDTVNKNNNKLIINYNKLRNELETSKIDLPPLDSLK